MRVLLLLQRPCAGSRPRPASGDAGGSHSGGSAAEAGAEEEGGDAGAARARSLFSSAGRQHGRQRTQTVCLAAKAAADTTDPTSRPSHLRRSWSVVAASSDDAVARAPDEAELRASGAAGAVDVLVEFDGRVLCVDGRPVAGVTDSAVWKISLLQSVSLDVDEGAIGVVRQSGAVHDMTMPDACGREVRAVQAVALDPAASDEQLREARRQLESLGLVRAASKRASAADASRPTLPPLAGDAAALDHLPLVDEALPLPSEPDTTQSRAALFDVALLALLQRRVLPFVLPSPQSDYDKALVQRLIDRQKIRLAEIDEDLSGSARGRCSRAASAACADATLAAMQCASTKRRCRWAGRGCSAGS